MGGREGGREGEREEGRRGREGGREGGRERGRKHEEGRRGREGGALLDGCLHLLPRRIQLRASDRVDKGWIRD